MSTGEGWYYYCSGFRCCLTVPPAQKKNAEVEDRQKNKFRSYTKEERFPLQERQWLRHWTVSPTASSHRFGVRGYRRPQLSSLTPTTRTGPLIKVLVRSAYVIDFPPWPILQILPHSENSHGEAVVPRACAKHLPTTLIYSHSQRLNSKIQYLTPNIWVSDKILQTHSTSTEKITVFEHWKSSHIFCSLRPCFRAVGQYRPHCCCVHSTFDGQPNVTLTPQILQIGECQSDVLCGRRHFV